MEKRLKRFCERKVVFGKSSRSMESMKTRYLKACFFGEMRVWVTLHSYKELFTAETQRSERGAEAGECWVGFNCGLKE